MNSLKLSKLKNLVPILVNSGEGEMDQTASSKVVFLVLSVHCLHKTKRGGDGAVIFAVNLIFIFGKERGT